MSEADDWLVVESVFLDNGDELIVTFSPGFAPENEDDKVLFALARGGKRVRAGEETKGKLFLVEGNGRALVPKKDAQKIATLYKKAKKWAEDEGLEYEAELEAERQKEEQRLAPVREAQLAFRKAVEEDK